MSISPGPSTAANWAKWSMKTSMLPLQKFSLPAYRPHPMSGKGVLVNPLLMAHDYISLFDRQQTPEHTRRP
ncbi:peptidase T [Pantoea agglomerans]|uniref:Peptidase T n=1 Tax=Enterobacter agglomerans TaxID=549 RepID=A0A379AFN2_ENTAG|nr:peptidase T [Pantoea agglomerans]